MDPPTIDANPDQLRTLGPQYLNVLVQLAMTSRGGAGASAGPGRSELDEFRARRLARLRAMRPEVRPDDPEP